MILMKMVRRGKLVRISRLSDRGLVKIQKSYNGLGFDLTKKDILDSLIDLRLKKMRYK